MSGYLWREDSDSDEPDLNLLYWYARGRGGGIDNFTTFVDDDDDDESNVITIGCRRRLLP